MSAKHVVVALLALAALTPAGCRRAASSGSVPASAAPPVATATPARTDYRTLSLPQLQELIQSKTGSSASLTAVGPNVYAGTMQSPDGTSLPVTVTVEEQKVVCETKTAAGSTRQTITPTDVKSDLNIP